MMNKPINKKQINVIQTMNRCSQIILTEKSFTNEFEFSIFKLENLKTEIRS